MQIKRKVLVYILSLAMIIGTIIPNTTIITKAADKTGIVTVLSGKWNDTENDFTNIDDAITFAINTNSANINLNGNTFTLNKEVTISGKSQILWLYNNNNDVNGKIILNKPIHVLNGAHIAFNDIDLVINCNNGLDISGYDTETTNYSFCELRPDKNPLNITNTASISGSNTNLISVSNNGFLWMQGNSNPTIITNQYATNALNITNNGRCQYDRGSVISNNNGINVYNAEFSMLGSGGNKCKISADKTAIKLSSSTDWEIQSGWPLDIRNSIIESKSVIVDAQTNNTNRVSGICSDNTIFQSVDGYNAKVIYNNADIWGAKLNHVSLDIKSNNEVYFLNGDIVNTLSILGSNNVGSSNRPIALDGAMQIDNIVVGSNASNSPINVESVILNNPLPTSSLFTIKASHTIEMDNKIIIGAMSSYVTNRDWQIGDSLKITDGSYTLPTVEDRQWVNSSEQVVTKATYKANDTNIYTLVEKPCEHTTTEVRNKVEPTCTETGYSGDTYCTHCGELIQHGSIVSAKGHTPSSTSVKEVLPTCTETGNKEYWTCTRCKKLFKDANCTQETTLAERTYSALGHNLLPTAEVPATCISTGVAQYWTCDRCNKIFADANGTNETTLDDLVTPIATKGHALVHHEEVPATCTTAGTKEYYECTMCNKKFSDSTCNTELTNLTITPKGHKYELITAVEPTCTENGNIECYTCTNTNCGKYFKDENGNKIEISANQVIVPKLGHIEGTATRENEIPATCTENGSYNEVVRCTRCQEVISSTPKTIVTEGHDWSDWSVVTPATEISVGSETRSCSKCSATETRDIPKINHVHDFKSISAVNPTCTENGNIAYVECKDCHKKYTDTTATTELNDEDIVLLTNGHDLVKHEAVEAKWEDGNIEYYSCKNCDKLFDKNNNEVTSVVIPKPDYEKVNVTKTNNYITKVRLTQNTNPTFEYSVDGIIKAEITESIPLMTDSGTVYEKTITISPLDNGHAIVLVKSPFNNAIIEGFDCTATIEVVNICNHATANQHKRVEPTCTENGSIAYYECPTCGKLFTDDTFTTEITNEKDLIIEATGHTEKLITTITPATCTENGYESTMTVCEKCGETLNSGTIVVTEQALGHDEKEYRKAVAPTCTANGYEEIEYICDRCGEHTRDTVRNVIPAVGHNKSNTIYNAETDDTFEYYFCPQCQKYFDTNFNEISENDTKKQHIDPPIMTNLSECSITGYKDAIYTGNAIKPTIKITHNGYTLKENLDYKLTYKNYLNVGKASVTITGLNSFTGSVTKYYNITARSISAATISGVPSYKIFTGSVIKPTITVKYKDKVVKTANYTVKYTNNTNVGTATITITGKGNFKGTVKKTFKINPKKATIKSVTAGTKSFTVKWTPQKTKMKTSYITGYQIQYSTDKNFAKNNKIVTATKYSTSSKVVKNLTAKKIYYVRIRTYKTVNNVKYYSTWSNTLKVKTK